MAALGVDFLGLVFHPKSPRNISLDQASEIATHIRDTLSIVAVTVNPDDELLDSIVSTVGVDLIQLHGLESPERAAEIKRKFGIGIIKAFGISTAYDFAASKEYADIADYFLFDTKPSESEAENPGGLGKSFDWEVMKNFKSPRPWFLAGGLAAGNIMDAVLKSGATLVDVSSGVESSPGVKDPGKICQFVAAVKRI